MEFDPEKHQRRSVRLEGYDYLLAGAYFVTILCFQRQCLFGEIKEGMMTHNDLGKMVKNCWLRIPNHFEDTRLDEFVLMPNHLHGIIIVLEAPGKGEAFARDISNMVDPMLANASPLRPEGTQSGSLGAIIQNFKSVSTRKVNKEYFEKGNKLWQRNYYERIIRNEREHNAIRQYIRDNPLNWEMDKVNPGKIYW